MEWLCTPLVVSMHSSIFKSIFGQRPQHSCTFFCNSIAGPLDASFPFQTVCKTSPKPILVVVTLHLAHWRKAHRTSDLSWVAKWLMGPASYFCLRHQLSLKDLDGCFFQGVINSFKCIWAHSSSTASSCLSQLGGRREKGAPPSQMFLDWGSEQPLGLAPTALVIV